MTTINNLESEPIPGCNLPKQETYTRQEIADWLGCSTKTLIRRLKLWGINTHGKRITRTQLLICLKNVGVI